MNGTYSKLECDMIITHVPRIMIVPCPFYPGQLIKVDKLDGASGILLPPGISADLMIAVEHRTVAMYISRKLYPNDLTDLSQGYWYYEDTVLIGDSFIVIMDLGAFVAL